MFNGYKFINNSYIYLYLDNNYEFASNINTKTLKQNEIIKDTREFLKTHNLNCNNRVYYVSNGIVIGYINKHNLYK
jgi:hypothetical protein